MKYQRFAIYYTPESALARRGAEWLGWDIETGASAPNPQIDGIDLHSATMRPRKYGFHGTIKAPFRLSPAKTENALRQNFTATCRALPPVELDRLELSRIGRFLALVPQGDPAGLSALASHVVETFDPFRAPLTTAEIEKRRPGRLSERQRAYLERWGYPFVKDDFKFHMTLTGNLKEEQLEPIQTAARAHFEPVLPNPFKIDTLTLVGEDEYGRFHQIEKHALAGQVVA